MTRTRRAAQLGLIAFILFEVWVAARGLEAAVGPLAPVIVMGSLILRFGLTFVVGAFLYALLILGWPAELSMLFSAPAIVLMLPRMLPDIADAVAWWKARDPAQHGPNRGGD